MSKANQTSQDNPLAATNFENYSHKDMKQQVHVSSLKIFDGEDLTYGNRKRLQQLQQKDWIDQQMQEKEDRKNYLKQTHQDYDQQQTHINSMALALEDAERQKRKMLEKSCKEHNIQQAYEKFDKARDDQAKEQADNQKHIGYCTTNDFQTENTQTCNSSISDTRYIPYHWKGMNQQERKDIRNQQETQQHQNKMLIDQEKTEEKLYSLQSEHQRFMDINQEREKVRQHKKKMDEIKEYNLLAAKEQKLKIKTMYD